MDRRMKRRNRKKEIDIVLLRSRRVFNAIYEEEKSMSVFLARNMFDFLVESGNIEASEAHRILSEPKRTSIFLDEAEKQYRKDKEESNKKILEETHEYAFAAASQTKLVKGIMVAVAINAAFLMDSAFISPFTSEWLSPTAKRLFGNNQPTVESPHMPLYAPLYQQSVLGCAKDTGCDPVGKAPPFLSTRPFIPSSHPSQQLH